MARPRKTTKAVKKVNISNDVEQSLHFNERDFQNYGKFVPYLVQYGHANSDADIRVNEYARKDLVNQSRHYVANLAEVKSAMQRLADFTIGNAVGPLYNGKNQDWATQVKANYLKKTLNNLTRLGIIADWQTLWQTIFKIVLEDGDVLIIPYKDRYGFWTVN